LRMVGDLEGARSTLVDADRGASQIRVRASLLMRSQEICESVQF
jgi:hypothetical protein